MFVTLRYIVDVNSSGESNRGIGRKRKRETETDRKK